MGALIFFDINGTIIKRDERTDIPYKKALNLLLNVQNSMDGVDTSARSDKDVFTEVLNKHGHSFSEQKWDAFVELYKEQLELFKTTDVWRENVDAVSIINKISQTDHKLSLITGEFSLGAQYKLQKIGVWDRFPVGGFGEDGFRRYDIAEVALKRVKEVYDDNFDEIYIIGDTLLDIKTARHLGAKIISITTGSNTREELQTENPDYIIDRFEEIEHLFI